MNLVVDSNILFSLIVSGKRSKAFEIIEGYDLNLFAPEEIILEFKRHKEKLHRFSKDFEYRTFLAFSLIRVIPLEFYTDKIKEAYEIASKFDEKDTPFIALSLKLNVPIWTGDKAMLRASLESGEFRAIDSKALMEILNGKELEKAMEEMKERI